MLETPNVFVNVQLAVSLSSQKNVTLFPSTVAVRQGSNPSEPQLVTPSVHSMPVSDHPAMASSVTVTVWFTSIPKD